MATITNPPHVRQLEAIRIRRTLTPYANWFDGAFFTNTHAHPTPEDRITAPPEIPIKATWSEENRIGSRHVFDTAPFSLWDEDKHDYVRPTKPQLDWVWKTYEPTGAQFLAPFFIVATEKPSLPGHEGRIPLTLGCAPVIFTSPETFQKSSNFGHPTANALHLIDRELPDPLIGLCQIKKWTQPDLSQVQEVFDTVFSFCIAEAISFVAPWIVIEISAESESSGPFPGVIAGWPVMYHHGSYWKQPGLHARLRELDASDFDTNRLGDTTNYLRSGDGIVGPGIRIEGRTRASSSGIRIRKGDQVRVLLANHAVADSQYLYHPDSRTGDKVADIVERYEDEDWALARLYPTVPYSNSRVFETPTPKRLIRGSEVQKAEWFVCDGMSTGKIAMRYQGSKWLTGVSGSMSRVDVTELHPASVYFCLSPTGGAPDVRDGICGAPVINEKTGGVVGSIQYMNEDGWCFTPELDQLIDDGWELY